MEDSKEAEDRKEFEQEQSDCQSSEFPRKPLASHCEDSNDEGHAKSLRLHVKPEGDLPSDAVASSPMPDEKEIDDLGTDVHTTAVVTVKLPKKNATGAVSESSVSNTLSATEDSQSASPMEPPVNGPSSEICSLPHVTCEPLPHPLPPYGTVDSMELLEGTMSLSSEVDASTFSPQEDALLAENSHLTVMTPLDSDEENNPATPHCTMPSTETDDNRVGPADSMPPVEPLTTSLIAESELSCAQSVTKSSEITQDAPDRPLSPFVASTSRDESVSTPFLTSAEGVEVSLPGDSPLVINPTPEMRENLASSAQSPSRNSFPIPAVQDAVGASPDSQKRFDSRQAKPVASESENLLTDNQTSIVGTDGSCFRTASPNVTYSNGENETDGQITEGITQEGTADCPENLTLPSSENLQPACVLSGQRSCWENDRQYLPTELTNGHSNLDVPLTTELNVAKSLPPEESAAGHPERPTVTKQLDRSLPSDECLSEAQERAVTSSQSIDKSLPLANELPSSEESGHVPSSSDGALTDNFTEQLVESPLTTNALPDQTSGSSVAISSSPSPFVSPSDLPNVPLTTELNVAKSLPPEESAAGHPERPTVTKQLDRSLPSDECLSEARERAVTSSQSIDKSLPLANELLSSEESGHVPSSSDGALTDNFTEKLVESPLTTNALPDQTSGSSVAMSSSPSPFVSPSDLPSNAQKSSQEASTTDNAAKNPLEHQVEYLSGQLIRAQSQLQSLLEEKHRWLVATRPLPTATPATSQGSPSLASEKAALVVKYAQSERLRCKAEARIKELEDLLHKNRGNSLTESSPLSPPVLQNDTKELQKQLEEMTKMLASSRERAETFRHSLRQEESRVGDLNAKLTAAREAHRSEQKRAASQVETISRLNRELESARRQLKEADRLREREAERLCNEVAAREATEKLHRAEAENAALEARLSEMGELEKQKEDLQTRLAALQASYDDLLPLKSELDYCQRRETQLSEFTRRLTERNAALQADYLSTQSRLEASERAVSEARQAADVAAELVTKAEAKLVTERTSFQQTIDSLETKVVQLTESVATLNSTLAREREERNALRRKQHAQDRELARLLAVHSLQKSSSTTAMTGTAVCPTGMQDRIHPENVAVNESPTNPENGETGSQLNGPSDSETPIQCEFRPPLGDALLASCDPSAETLATTPAPPTLEESREAREELPCPAIQMVEPSKSLLVNKIEKLQRMNLRLSEKNDFMRDHINQLMREVQRKTQLLQHFLVSDPEAGGTSPMNVDENKANIIQKGGLMASVFSGQAMDSQANLKVCLQINQKLQNVLEDTLFKNITLKENVDTLADELARLTRANRELKELVSKALPPPPSLPTVASSAD
nr:unnamed protein product [Spirometra erinaceieuropaei]